MVKWVVQRGCGIFILELSPWIQLEEALSNLDLAGTCFVQGTAREVPWPHPKFLCSVVWCNNLKHEWCWFKLTHQLLSCNSCHSCEIQAQQPPETAMPQVVLVRVCGNPTVLLISLKIKLIALVSSQQLLRRMEHWPRAANTSKCRCSLPAVPYFPDESHSVLLTLPRSSQLLVILFDPDPV